MLTNMNQKQITIALFLCLIIFLFLYLPNSYGLKMISFPSTSSDQVVGLDIYRPTVESTTGAATTTTPQQHLRNSTTPSSKTLMMAVTHNCSNQPPVNRVVLPEDCTYQPVINGVTWIMSAHVDPRRSDVVLLRLFGLSLEMSALNNGQGIMLYCQLWDENGQLVATAASTMKGIYLFGFK